MAKFVLSVRGVKVSGRHGANRGEQDEAQEFVVDLDVEVEVHEDALEKTVDYRTLADAARRTVETTSFVLLESLAQAVADRLRDDAGVGSARITVHKPSAARSMNVEDVTATATSRG
ncbi:MAG TPA: dihydroneopterin aldolase [Actinomycetota bacterium]|nr:dihydroneopterin aldolase [Actinomycetota bacterium]